jgi:hypothetical protein
MALGESARGGFRPPAHLPPRISGVGEKMGKDGASGDGSRVGKIVARAAAMERRGLRRRDALAVPAELRGAHPLFLPGVAHPLFLTGWRDEQQGEEGEEGGGGGHPLFVPGYGDEQRKGKGEKRWSGGGVRTRVEGDPMRDFGDRRVGDGDAVGDKVGVGEGGVPTGGDAWECRRPGCRCEVGGRSGDRGR